MPTYAIKNMIFLTFVFGSNKPLGELIRSRLIELGYKQSTNYPCGGTFSVHPDSAKHGNQIYWGNWSGKPHSDHQYGDLNKLFMTDEYRSKWVEPMRVGEYTIQFNETGIKFGCTDLDRDQMIAIIKRFNKTANKAIELV